MKPHPLTAAIELLGLSALAMHCDVTYQAVRKWEKKGRLPRTEYTGETDYAARIAAACREKDQNTNISRETLLGAHPARAERLVANA